MSLFDKLFGGKPASASGAKTTAPSNLLAQFVNMKTQWMRCDICKKDRRIVVAENGFINYSYTFGSDVDRTDLPILESCERCDLDHCGSCAVWQQGRSPVEIHDARLLAKICAPTCSRCGDCLTAKGNVDQKRIQQFHGDLSVESMGTPAARVFLRRLLEHHSFYENVITTPRYKTIKELLIDEFGPTVFQDGSMGERLSACKQKVQEFQKEQCDVISLFRLLISVDHGFQSRCDAYPTVTKIAQLIHTSAGLEIDVVRRQADALLDELSKGAKEDIFLLEELHSLKIKRIFALKSPEKGAAFFQEAINLGQKRKLDFKKYPEVLRYAEVTRLTMLINSAEGREQELSRFQEMLLHDLDAGR